MQRVGKKHIEKFFLQFIHLLVDHIQAHVKKRVGTGQLVEQQPARDFSYLHVLQSPSVLLLLLLLLLLH